MKSLKPELPYNLEAEKAVIASAIIDNSALDKIIDVLYPDDFYTPLHQYLYSRIIKLYNHGLPVDIVTLINNADEKIINNGGGLEYIATFPDILSTSANIKHYANIVVEKSIVRQLISSASGIVERCYDNYESIGDLIEEAEKNIFLIAEKRTNTNVKQIRAMLHGIIDNLEHLYKNKGTLSGLSTGYKKLDQLINGFQSSDLIIIAGRPGMGKTAFALNVALNAAMDTEKKSVAFFTLEMSSEQLAQRLISALGRVESAKMRNGYFTQKDWEKLISASAGLADLNFFLDDTPGINPLELRAKCRRIKKEHGLDIVFIDYLQLMSSVKGDNRE